MADDKHIERIGASDSDIRGNLDSLQIAIQTDDEEALVWANSGATAFRYAAAQYRKDAGGVITYIDAQFKDLTARNDIFANEYIKRRGDAADYIRLQNDQMTLAAGSVAALEIEPKRIYTAVSMGIGGTPKSSILGIDGTMQLKEQAAAGASDSGYGQFWVKNDNTPQFTPDTGVDKQLAVVGAAKGEMYMYEANETVTINTIGAYHAIKGFTAGLLSDWTFQDGRVVDANITSEADNTVLRIVTSGAHNLSTDDVVTCTGMNNAGHNKPTRVTVINATTFDCQDINYVADAGVSSGVIDEPGYLQAGTASAGDYSINYSMSGEAVGADTYKLEVFCIATEKDNTAAELDLSINDLGPIPGTGFLGSVVAGNRVWLGCNNKTGTNNFLITHANVNLHRL